MKSLCLSFQVHQPVHFRRYRFFDIGSGHYYYDDYSNENRIRRVASECYLPANDFLLQQINRMEGRLKVAFYLSGVTLDQFRLYAPEVTESFQKLAGTGCVGFLGGTYSHSLAVLGSQEAFTAQVLQHQEAMAGLAGQNPVVFQNPGLLYSDELGARVAGLGFRGMLTEGAGHILGWKSPRFLYCNAIHPRLKILMRHVRLSGELSRLHGAAATSGNLFTPAGFLAQILDPEDPGDLVNIAIDYETFDGIRHTKSGMLRFLDHFFLLAGQSETLRFVTPGEITDEQQPVSLIHVPHPVSWAGEESGLSPWSGNDLQEEALNKLYSLVPLVEKCNDRHLLNDWNYLQISDHFRYMSDSPFNGPVHNNANPFLTPWEAFINYMNVLNDFTLRLEQQPPEENREDEILRLRRLIREKDRELLILRKEKDQLRKIKNQPGKQT